jgi:L-lysine 2,3-aminomutase
MGATSKLNKDNIISTSLEELSKEERQDYLVAEEHFKAQFLKAFKKNRQGKVMRVQAFVMSSFTPKNKLVEVFDNVITSSSDLLSQLSSIMDQKVADSHKSTSDLLINRMDELDILKKSQNC